MSKRIEQLCAELVADHAEHPLSVHELGDSVVLVLRHAPYSVRLLAVRAMQGLLHDGRMELEPETEDSE